MADFLEIVFLMHILITLGVTIYKTYNILHKGEKYSLGTAFILFIVFCFGWFLGLVIVTTDPIGSVSSNVTAYSLIFIFTSGFFLLNILYTIIELILTLRVFSNKQIQAYNSFKEYKINTRN